MAIDLTKKSQELKEFVSQFETTMFLGDIASMMQYINSDSPMESLKGLSSPQRQLLYLAGLNISSIEPKKNTLKAQYSDEDFRYIKDLLNEIEEGYYQFFSPNPNDVIDDDWKKKRMVAMPYFLNYFNQGLLNYEEQIIERVELYFSPFNSEIKSHFGLEVSDFVDIYNFIDTIPNNFLKENIHKKEGQQTWEEWCNEMDRENIMPWDTRYQLPEHFEKRFSWVYDKGKMFRFSRKLIEDKFGIDKTSAFIDCFTCERQKRNFLYYTEINPIYNTPIFKINDAEFQVIEMQQIIQAIYNKLFDFCTSQPSLREKFYSGRGKKLEEKIEKIFQRFFENKAVIYKNYFNQKNHEQDLLFLNGGLALIIEAKASKKDEPRREPKKAYPTIEINFKETIQKGYDQAYRIKSKFIDKETLSIYRDKDLKNHVIDIKTKKYPHAFSIVVTLQRFGQIQTDLESLLEVYNDDTYPWSICIDDLEALLLFMEKKRHDKKTPN